MTKVAIIGNSHVAALKAAWDATPLPGLDMTFFAAPQRNFRQFALQPNRVYGLPAPQRGRHAEIVQKLNGALQIDLSGVDQVVLSAFGWNPGAIAQLIATCDIDGLRLTGAPTLLSRDLFDAICAALARALRPGPEWRHWPGAAPIFLAQAATCETCLGSSNADFASWQRLAAAPDGALAAFDIFFDHLRADLAGVGITLLRQPPQSLRPSGLTEARFLATGGGVVPGQEHLRGDHAHMNAAYGTLCLTALHDLIRRGPSPAPIPQSDTEV
ncbi:hypothetical protein [Rhodobacter ferrooxidans]|uniref:Uncharacterized protein n=1 Tax=Rhodobacter ferrooxidans TaxID=371731 RepID=C8RXT6_9RHOB|nr:hypothetical protein [Rhodobacter sp. SW2]EEW26334.1 hypothetical protein Rsw2DRAFT_0614 [Rhodobacter sp. SW2]